MSPTQWRGPVALLAAWAVFMTLYFSWWSTNTSPNLPNTGKDKLPSPKPCPSCICPPQSAQSTAVCPAPPKQSCPPPVEKIINVCPPTTPTMTAEQKKETCILNESINLEPPKPGYLTGPRDSPIKKRAKSLVTIPVGAVSKQNVNKIIQKFGLENFQFMLFHYDEADWSDQDWYWDVISIRILGRMKWWYLKRFVHPAVADSYEYIFAIDEDSDPEQIDVPKLMNVLRTHKVGLAQPAAHALSERSVHTITHQVEHKDSEIVGRWTDFVECGPFTIVSSEWWNGCVWEFLQEDLTSGWGLDLYWHDYCKKKLGKEATAVIDAYPQIHRSYETTVKGKGDSKRPKPVFSAWVELETYQRRFPTVAKASMKNMGELRMKA